MNVILDLCAGALLVTALLTVWRRSQRGVVRVIAVQGVALAGLVAVVAARTGDANDLLVVALVLLLKGIVLPWLLDRRLASLGALSGVGAPALDDDAPLLNPTATVVFAAVLSIGAYAVVTPLLGDTGDPAVRLTPLGVAVVLIGLLAMSTRGRAISQLVGFLVLDNGIAAVAFFSSGGVPLLVEFASSFDLLLVVVILQVFTVRLKAAFGDTDVRRLKELHD
ncbi:MAG TPA: hypothetical protein VGC45_03855 [Gryllotalpicola sp.]